MPRLRLPIQNPCHESWDAMRGDAQRRHCEVCRKHVHHLSQMTERQARSLLTGSGKDRVCVRYTCNPDGSVRFRPETTPAPAALRRLATPVLATVLAACTPHGKTPDPEITDDPVEIVMGAIPVVPDQPPVVEVMGEAPALPPTVPLDEPCGTDEPEAIPDPPRVKMGKIARRRVQPDPEPEPEPEPAREFMGDVAFDG